MSSIKNNLKETDEIDEFVNSDGSIISGDRNATSDSEIETGPVSKPFNDDSEYEKGVSTTTDRASRYRQDIPWFAVYSYGGLNRNVPVNEKVTTLTKNQIDEDIKEDLVKKNKNDREVIEKNFDAKLEKVVDTIADNEFTTTQLEKIKKAVLDKLGKKDE